ncbi:putative Swr1p complex component (Swc5) [Aspergillus brunneoviolaceus CBS 621.78]|uniref:BCNT-domain-containing protein n=1 Tax=Aspergillus brunneoviolaceus CBS 621.78 TaxID=1450534 RepID=A0ACD1GB65_9EURO|nr:BCNT-domain-containing protein [Aspergillus brunneoviolaceus CBS 621.78]RAH46491.1 BCNT-domain-containing protein [Aspergillus brunneoviolaceus CBS 621.78]
MAPDAEPTAAAADLIIDEDEYNSDSDSDFQLDDDFAAQNDDDAGLTSSDEEDNDAAAAAAAADGQPQAKRRKTTTTTQGPTATGELDSGDEATIHKDKAKRKTEDDEEEEGGTGGFVRTRAMKMRAQDERKTLAKIDGATVDVDALWAMMNAPENNNTLHAGSSSSSSGKNDDNAPTTQNGDVEMQESSTETEQSKQQQKPSKYAEEMIKIKRTYKFAGEMITEEKIVPKDSAEAKLYLANNGDANVETVITAAVEDATATTTTEDVAIKLRRPLRRVSRFDPNPTGAIKKSWEKQPAAEITGQDENARGPKINTVEKSRMDWAAYVDSAGLKDELKVHSKAKEGFHGRMEFLDRVGANIEEERRNARLKGL